MSWSGIFKIVFFLSGSLAMALKMPPDKKVENALKS